LQFRVKMHRAPWYRATQALYGFVGAFIVIALAFLGSSVATVFTARSIDADAQDLLTNALPSVTELMRARSAQRRLDVDLDMLSRARGARAELLDELTSARAELDTALAAAMATPFYGGERDIYESQVAPRLAVLDQSLDGLRATAIARSGEDPAFVTALTTVTAAARQLDEGLASLAELNHAHAYDAATRIVSTRQTTSRLTLLLDVLSCIVAITAAAIALRGGRRFAVEARQEVDHECERAAELDVLAQRVAHDLMSPLATVALSLASIERACPQAETTRVLDRARRALDRSRQMVQGIYAFSESGARPVPGASSPLRSAVLEAADALLGSETHTPPVVDVQPFDEALVAMDHDVLGVVVTNLLSNAFKFTREAPVRRVNVRERADDHWVHLEIEDTGPGVPPGLESAIFEPYRRAPGVTQPGLGLGLATVKRLVLAHGGKLGVRPARAGGAVFWIELPRARASRAKTESPAVQVGGGEPHPVH
jgi:signal transduction histidine kinase